MACFIHAKMPPETALQRSVSRLSLRSGTFPMFEQDQESDVVGDEQGRNPKGGNDLRKGGLGLESEFFFHSAERIESAFKVVASMRSRNLGADAGFVFGH